MSTPKLTPAQQCVLRFLNALHVAQTKNAIYAVMLMHGHRVVLDDVIDPLESCGFVHVTMSEKACFITSAGQQFLGQTAAAASERK